MWNAAEPDGAPIAARRVSVIIPCYNHAALLPRAVNSAIAQTGGVEVEAIIVDDGSTDSTPAVSKALAEEHANVRIVRKPNGGLSSARNAGIRAATGAYVHFLDADDYIAPNAYERLVAALEARPDAGVAYCGYEFIDAGAAPVRSLGEPTSDIRERLLHGTLGPVHSFLLRREAVGAAGAFDETLRSCEDWDFLLRVAFAGFDFVHVPEVLVTYPRGNANMSSNLVVMLSNAKAVLAKAAAYAGGERYAQARRAGLEQLTGWFFTFCCDARLTEQLSAGRIGAVARELATVAWHDRKCAWIFVKWLANHKRLALRGIATRVTGARQRRPGERS